MTATWTSTLAVRLGTLAFANGPEPDHPAREDWGSLRGKLTRTQGAAASDVPAAS